MRLAEAAPKLEAAREDDRGGDRPECDAPAGADPAAVHGEDEEEDDPEQRHDPAGDGESARPEQVELERLARLTGLTGRRCGGLRIGMPLNRCRLRSAGCEAQALLPRPASLVA